MSNDTKCKHVFEPYWATCVKCGNDWEQTDIGRKALEREEAQRIYAEHDTAMGYELDDEGNSYHDYS